MSVLAGVRQRSGWLVLVPSAVLLALGGAAALAGWDAWRDGCWGAAGAIGLLAATMAVARGIVRRTAGVDVLALLAIAGALWTDEFLAAALIAVMIGTGTVLDQWAEASARRELSALLARSPRLAHRLVGDDVVEVPVGEVVVGDLLLIGSGEIVPVDARLLLPGTFDESALTGESAPVERAVGEEVRSGIVNGGPSVRAVAVRDAENSTYSDVVRLVAAAQAQSAPYVRFADRIAWWFIPLALGLAGVAWLASGEPSRAVAVLVVATPCPLLLAVPVAIISGVSMAARRGVVVKGGSVLEQLAAGRVLLFDKTGTLTRGQPDLVAVHPAPGWSGEDVLSAAASLDQASPHVLATAIVKAARARGCSIEMPAGVEEVHGHGVRGVVAGRPVAVGKAAWILGDGRPEWARRAKHAADLEGCVTVFVAVGGAPVGALLLVDVLRPEAPRMLRSLRAAGFGRMVLVSGDRLDIARSVGALAGVDEVRAEQTPAQKVEVVVQERAHGPVVMVGDGINDAPALAAADVGVAMAGRGATASSEAAGVVLTVERIDRLGEAVLIARRARRIAAESAWVGMGLSALAMLAAAFGFLPAAAGALLQELIDVLAIGNALRVQLVRPRAQVQLGHEQAAMAALVRAEHDQMRRVADRIRDVAEQLEAPAGAGGGADAGADAGGAPRAGGDAAAGGAEGGGARAGVGACELAPDVLTPVRGLLVILDEELLPHERREEAELLPAMASALGGVDPVGGLSRTHAEIERQVGILHRIVEDADADGSPNSEQAVREARRTLYMLYGVVLLHNAQEDEGVYSLLE